MAQAQSGPFVYVPNNGDSDVTVIDTSTNSAGSTAPAGNTPEAAAVTDDESVVYVTNRGSGNVTPINTATNTAGTPIAVGLDPVGLAVSPDGKTVYVANSGDNNVTPINTVTGIAGTPIPVGTDPIGVVITPDGKTVYVTNQLDNTVTPINTATNTAGTPIPVGHNPNGMAVSPDGTTLYVANTFSNSVTPINIATNTAGTPIAVGANPFAVAVSPEGKTLYVANYSNNTVTPITIATNTVGTPIPVGANPFGLAISPDGKTLYVDNRGDSTVTPIDTATNTAGTPIASGDFPGEFPGICSNGNALLATGLTFKANTSGALSCTLASGPTGSSGPVFTGGTMQFAGANISSSLPISLQAAGGIFDTDGNNATLSGAISGPGGLTKIGLGTLTVSGTGTYLGPTAVNVGTLQAGAAAAFSIGSAYTVANGAILDLNDFDQSIGSLAGVGNVTLGSGTLTIGHDGTSTTYSGNISGSGGLTKIGGGIFTLSGTSSYLGATNVNAGTLEVDGSIATSSLTTVNSPGTLSGIGTVSATQVNAGGTFAPGSGSPGTSTVVAGTLAFLSGAIYVVQVNPSTASLANVTGTASLAGTVQATFAAGSYLAKQYDILHSAGRSGMFGTLDTTNLPSGFSATLSYNGTDALLNLTATLGMGPSTLSTGGLNGNQQNVANALNTFFNSGGTLPPNFVTIFGLSGGNLGTALTQINGEAATDAETGAFAMMTSFLGIMLDPFVDGRSGSGGPSAGGGASGFAPEQDASFPPDIALAYAGVLKTPPKPSALDQRWSEWGSSFGGYNKTNGDPTVGSNTVVAHDYGFAGGMDYHFSPDTMAGFALAGGSTNWGLEQGLGGGRSDAFQAGVYGTTRFGPAYIAVAFAGANHWMTTNRVAFAGDQLTAGFNAQSFGGRFETGYRYAMLPTTGVTPYAALQAQSFHTPSYSETDVTGGGFALSYNAMTGTDTRSEMGARFDDLTMLGALPLTLRARAAWAHDWVSNPSLNAVFQALPGASFTVNGAAPPRDSALTTAAAELHLAANWSVAAKFDSEFGRGSQTYSGTGTLRHTW